MAGDAADAIHVLDITRAHQHCDLTRQMFIRLPKEDPRSEEDDTCGLLQNALNGVGDAAQAFEQRVKRLCIEVGAWQGAFNPCTYHHPEWEAVFMRHCSRTTGMTLSSRVREGELETSRIPRFALGGRSED
eukprot:5127457-Amphidinium_carterae.1